MTQPFDSRSQLSSSIERYNYDVPPPTEFPQSSSSILFHLCGLALIIGEIVNTVVWFPFSPFFTPSLTLSHILYAIGALSLFLAHSGVMGLHMRQAQRAGWLSLVSVMFLFSSSVCYAINIFLIINLNQLPDTLNILFIALNDGGLVLLGLAIIRASVFPRWTGLLFITSGTLLAIFSHASLDAFLNYGLFNIVSILLCIAYLRCAYILLQQKVRLK
jgi:hypothetical protein